MNPFEIVKQTPKSNCGKCGRPSCLAFASAVAMGAADPAACPYLDPVGMNAAKPATTDLDQLAQERDLALVAHLKSKIASIDLAGIATALGAVYDSEPGREALVFTYLGQSVRISAGELLLDGLLPADPRDQILLYNYVHAGGGAEPVRNWIGLESLPNSISKVRTLATYCEDRLAALFDGKPQALIIEAAKRLGATVSADSSADLALLVPVLPRVPQYLLYWRAEPEDGFAARVKVLFDHGVLDFLDIESLVFSAERLADRLSLLLGNRP